jgi:hypothetical protein
MTTLLQAVEAWKRLWDTGKGNNDNNTKKDKRKQKKGKQKRKLRRSKKETIKQYQQRSLRGVNLDKLDTEEFGDKLQEKVDGILRIMLHNIANIPEDKRTSKSRQLMSYIVQKQADAFLMTEVGLCWKKVDSSNQWFERIFGKFRNARSVFAYNKTELSRTKVLQPGGVGMIVTDDASHKVCEQGRDETGLGRWTWVRLQGKDGVKVRILTAYRPCDSVGPDTVNEQHYRYLRKHRKGDTAPRTAFYEDLFPLIKSWKNEGDHVIIGMDANEDVRCGETQEFFRALDMNEAILSRHKDKSPPATYNRNESRQPIDGIWTTSGLTAFAAGYAAFGDGCPSDHRVLWVDFTYQDALGHEPPPLIEPPSRRLKADDPRLVKNYNEKLRRC